jgi:hypothetical protein
LHHREIQVESISSSGVKGFGCVDRRLEFGHSKLQSAAVRFAGTRARLEIIDASGSDLSSFAFPSD